jgi:hypothetical protein
MKGAKSPGKGWGSEPEFIDGACLNDVRDWGVIAKQTKVVSPFGMGFAALGAVADLKCLLLH